MIGLSGLLLYSVQYILVKTTKPDYTDQFFLLESTKSPLRDKHVVITGAEVKFGKLEFFLP